MQQPITALNMPVQILSGRPISNDCWALRAFGGNARTRTVQREPICAPSLPHGLRFNEIKVSKNKYENETIKKEPADEENRLSQPPLWGIIFTLFGGFFLGLNIIQPICSAEISEKYFELLDRIKILPDPGLLFPYLDRVDGEIHRMAFQSEQALSDDDIGYAQMEAIKFKAHDVYNINRLLEQIHGRS